MYLRQIYIKIFMTEWANNYNGQCANTLKRMLINTVMNITHHWLQKQKSS